MYSSLCSINGMREKIMAIFWWGLDPPICIRDALYVIWHFVVKTAQAKWRCGSTQCPITSGLRIRVKMTRIRRRNKIKLNHQIMDIKVNIFELFFIYHRNKSIILDLSDKTMTGSELLKSGSGSQQYIQYMYDNQITYLVIYIISLHFASNNIQNSS